MRLDTFSSASFDRGASRLKEALWMMISAALVSSWIPGSGWRRLILIGFGAKVGRGVVLKPGIRIKFPWRLKIGDHSWIGEDVWIDNLGEVLIGSHACVSQGAYLCTGSHDWSMDTFDLIVNPIRVGDHAWVGARAVVAPGTVFHDGSILVLGGVASGNLEAWKIHYGLMNPKSKARNHS